MPRRTLLIIVERHLLKDAIVQGLALAEGYEEMVPGSLADVRRELYAVGEAARIQRRTRLPSVLRNPSSAGTSTGAVHAMWSGGLWSTPSNCAPAPPDANGATDWQWAHYNAVMGAAPTAHFLLWDVYWRAEEGSLAA
jgi:hypothetical protein